MHRAAGTRPTLAELDTFVRQRDRGIQSAAQALVVDEVKRSPAGKPDYRWAKDTTEERPADDVHANHAGAQT